MAKRLAIPSKELALKIVGPRDSFLASRVQRITLNNEIPSTTVDEHGNPNHVGVMNDSPNVTLTFDAFDVSTKIFSTLTGTNQAAYPASGVNIDQLDEVDAILYVKDPDVAEYVKSAHAKRLQIRDFSFSYNVTGESTESYTAVGSEKRWFKYDVVVDKFTTPGTSFTLSETPIQLKNGNYLLSVILDGDYLTEVSGAPATGQYRAVGTTLTTGDSATAQVLVVYHANTAGTWTSVSDATIPAAVRGKNVKIIMSANDIPRVQSVTLNGNLNPQAVREMGNASVVGYQKQVPTVDGTITVLDTDLELITLLTTGDINSSDVEFLVEGACSVVSGVQLDIKLYDPCDTDVVVKTLRVPTMKITGDSYTSNINENAQTTFNFMSDTAELLVFSGAPTPA